MKATRPKPPEELDGEALLEWHRVCDELDDAGRLDRTDRAGLLLYARTWAIHQDAMRHVAQHGAVVKLPNNVICGSPYYKVAQETLKQLRGMLNDMGLTYSSRPKSTNPADAPLEY